MKQIDKKTVMYVFAGNNGSGNLIVIDNSKSNGETILETSHGIITYKSIILPS